VKILQVTKHGIDEDISFEFDHVDGRIVISFPEPPSGDNIDEVLGWQITGFISWLGS
jgi:hypothetical protein